MTATAPEVNVTMTDASEQMKPEIIHIAPEEGQAMKNAGAYLKRITAENDERTAIAQNQIQANLWQLASKYGVDLSAYEFNMESGGFKKK